MYERFGLHFTVFFLLMFIIETVCLRHMIMCSAVCDAFSDSCFTGLWLPRNGIQTKYPFLAFFV